MFITITAVHFTEVISYGPSPCVELQQKTLSLALWLAPWPRLLPEQIHPLYANKKNVLSLTTTILMCICSFSLSLMSNFPQG